MSESCCSTPPGTAWTLACPASGFDGKLVEWATVVALTVGPVPAKQEFRLCRDAECEVVYYGSAGTVLTKADLSVQPGFKVGSDGLVCYCFLHRRDDFAGRVREGTATDIFDSIKREVRAGNCACELRNPSGKCCLGEVEAVVRGLEQELEGTA